MRSLHSLITILLVGLSLWNCTKQDPQYIYPQDDKFSKPNGEPYDSSTFFFPTELNYGDSVIKTNIESLYLHWYSSQLLPAKEMILFNHYLGQDSYRFTWLRAFDEPTFFTITKKSDHVWLTFKKLDRQPKFMETTIVTGIVFSNPIDTTQKKYSIQFPDRHANIKINETKELSIKEWDQFENLLNEIGYWKMAPTLYEDPPGVDGQQWIIEAHLKNKYWFVDRWSPRDDYRKAGEYLVTLSGIDEKIN